MSDSCGEVFECEKCHNFFEKAITQKGERYEGINTHHNPPEYLFESGEKWSGELYELCRDCHYEDLHEKIKIILNKKVRTLKFVNSEYWVVKRMSIQQRQEVRKEIFEFTKRWLNEVENDNPNS